MLFEAFVLLNDLLFSVEHVDDNLGAAMGRLPDAAERLRMEQFFDGL